MKLIFLSNYYTHHQKALCEQFDQLTNHSFLFISTEKFSDERKNLGWNEEKKSFSIDINDDMIKSIENVEYVIFGSAPRYLLDRRLKQNKLVFIYSERIYKYGYNILKWPVRMFRFWQRYGRYKNLYMLCASAYTAADYAKHFTFLQKTYKWGYFPETIHYDTEALMKEKDRKKILWCGRFLDWKHPDDVIKVAEKLKIDGYEFEIDFIGSGELESTLKEMIQKKGLEDNVHILGSVSPDQVRKNMEKTGIYLFTSGFQEGWGAVLNESMNSGCAVVASHAIGSVPFLMTHQENGFIYKNGNVEDLYNKVKFLLDHPEEQKRLGINAYHTIVDLWNAEVAADRFLKFAKEIKDHGYCDLYEEGPCSRAQIIKNNWFKG